MTDFLGLSVFVGNVIAALVIAYFIIKWAVKDGVIEAYEEITGNKVYEDQDFEEFSEEMKEIPLKKHTKKK